MDFCEVVLKLVGHHCVADAIPLFFVDDSGVGVESQLVLGGYTPLSSKERHAWHVVALDC
jgi:hypothetical protein